MNYPIPFNKPFLTGRELTYIREAVAIAARKTLLPCGAPARTERISSLRN